MPIVPEIQERLELAFPRSSDVTLFRAVQEATFAASHLIGGDRFLSNSLGRDLHGHIRRVCISYLIEQYCQRGDLPFVSEVKRMPKGPLHWLEIISTGAIAHVCRVPDEAFSFPDEAESRQDYRLTIQGDLLSWVSADDKPSLGKIIRVVPRLYAWLTFHASSDGKVHRLCWGSPAADVNEWIAYIDVLNAIAKAGGSPPEVSSTPSPKGLLRLRDHVVEQVKKPTDDRKI